jgi:hypothetical protein
MGFFVWSKMQAEAGEGLEGILARKEAERTAGGGVFWWGIGHSLGSAVLKAAQTSGGTLPVLFSKMLGRPKKGDVAPEQVFLWTTWMDADGCRHKVPSHVLVTSRASTKRRHYALVCHMSHAIALNDHGPFDPKNCWTWAGNVPGDSQVTALLSGEPAPHSDGRYRRGFCATLVPPLAVKLIDGRLLTQLERGLLRSWRDGGDWHALVQRLRQP